MFVNRVVLSSIILAVFITNCVFAQSAYQGEKKVAVLCVQFYDEGSNPDARGGRGRYQDNSIDQKYIYKDYYDIIFSNAEVMHPDAAIDPSYSRSGVDWNQHGGFNRYIRDNSYNACSIGPCDINSADSRESGILNPIRNTDLEIQNCEVDWLTLFKRYKPTESEVQAMENQEAGSSLSNLLRPIGREAILKADSLYNSDPNNKRINWDEIDLVVVLYAGESPFGAATVGTVEVGSNTVNFSIHAETYNRCFTYPLVIFHEACHALFCASDLYDVDNSDGRAGHYSLMGGNPKYQAYTPPMLDPWHRLRYGWLTVDIRNSGCDLIDEYSLHIVESPNNGSAPSVAVIPVAGTIASGEDYADNSNAYFIIENRRRTGWDINLNYNDNVDDQNFGQTSSTNGGFLVWGWGTVEYGMLHFYGADGLYDQFRGWNKYGDPGDFFDGSTGRDLFCLWTNPGIFDKINDDRDNYLYKYRNLFVKFGEYSTFSTENTFERFSIGVPFATLSAYESTSSPEISIDDRAPMKTNTQNKFCSYNGDQYLMVHPDSLLVIYRSSNNGQSWNDVFLLNEIHGIGTGRRIIRCDNGCIASVGDQQNGGVWAICEMEHPYNPNYLSVHRAKMTGEDLDPTTDDVEAPYSRPSIDALDDRIAYAYRNHDVSEPSNCGIKVMWGSDNGSTWSDLGLVNSTIGSGEDPSIQVIKREDPNNPGDYEYGYLLAYIDYRTYEKPKIFSSFDPFGLGNTDYVFETSPSMDYHQNEFVVVTSCTGERDNQINLYRNNALTFPNTGYKIMYHEFVNSNREITRNPVVKLGNDVSTQIVSWIDGNSRRLLAAENISSSGRAYTVFRPGTLGLSSYPSLHAEENRYISLFSPVKTPFTEGEETRIAKTNPMYYSSSLYTTTAKSITLTDPATGESSHLSVSAGSIFNHGSFVGSVEYDMRRPLTYVPLNVTETDSLMVTGFAELFKDDYVSTEIQLDQPVYVFDTLVIEMVLVDSTSNNVLSSSGELRIPGDIGDTTLTAYLELPGGFQYAKCYLTSLISEGPFASVGSVGVNLGIATIYSDSSLHKHAIEAAIMRGAEDLNIYPTVARSGDHINIVLDSRYADRVVLYDQLGRAIISIPVHSSAPVRKTMELDLGILPAGVYSVILYGPEMTKRSSLVVVN
jgi:M6 family metalloprotease-like protein